MFFALHDTLRLRRMRYAYVNWTLIGLNVILFTLFQSGWFLSLDPELSFGFGMIPSVLFGTQALPPYVLHAPAGATLVTELFLHGGWAHLLSNMLFLQVFGNNVEDAMGHMRYFLFYLLVGIIAGASYAYLNPSAQAPLIGASGAISGVLAAYMLLHPRARVFGLLFGILPVHLPAFFAVGTWIAFQAAQAIANSDHSVAFVAHLSGFCAGLLLVAIFKARDVELFSQER